MMSKQFKNLPIHPFLIATYAVLALLSHNIEEIKPSVATRSLLISLGASLLLFLVLRIFIRNWQRAAILTTITLALFFSYGHVYDFLEQTSILGLSLGRHRFLVPLWLAMWAGSIWWIARQKHDFSSWTQALNLITIFAMVFPLAQIGLYSARLLEASSSHNAQASAITPLSLPKDQPAPDIYYIILDAYSRDDTLRDVYQMDNTSFLNQLEQTGFYVARCSQSNYAQTQLSLGSSLNFNYLETLSGLYTPGHTTRVGIEDFIRHNAARKDLEQLGYKIVAFETGFMGTQWEDADLYLSPSKNPLGNVQVLNGMNSFEALLLRTSAGLLLMDSKTALPRFLQPGFDNPQKIHRNLILYDLDQLHDLPSMPGPKFVFAHMVIPHPPYVFGPNGEYINYDREDIPAYRDQVTFINKRILELVKHIIAASATQPIIILQGDHGGVITAPNDRMKIFNAYYLPNGGEKNLYPDITPVNSFRVIFDTYFGANYQLLKDTSLYSTYEQPFNYTVIPDNRPGCNPKQ